MVDHISAPDKQTATLIELTYGDKNSPKFVRFTDANESVRYLGKVFLPAPITDIELAPNEFGVGSGESTKIELPLLNPVPEIADFLGQVSDTRPFSGVEVQISELHYNKDRYRTQEEIYHLYHGYLDRSIRHPSGKTNQVRLSFSDLRQRMKKRLNFKCSYSCSKPFGGKRCKLDIQKPYSVYSTAALCTEAYMSFVNRGFVVNIHPAQSIAESWMKSKLVQWWQNGYFQYDGLVVEIRSWAQGTNTFTMTKQVPLDWGITTPAPRIGMLYPGCGHQIEDCRFWNNEEHFGGYAYSMPHYNPRYETGNR